MLSDIFRLIDTSACLHSILRSCRVFSCQCCFFFFFSCSSSDRSLLSISFFPCLFLCALFFFVSRLYRHFFLFSLFFPVFLIYLPSYLYRFLLLFAAFIFFLLVFFIIYFTFSLFTFFFSFLDFVFADDCAPVTCLADELKSANKRLQAAGNSLLDAQQKVHVFPYYKLDAHWLPSLTCARHSSTSSSRPTSTSRRSASSRCLRPTAVRNGCPSRC